MIRRRRGWVQLAAAAIANAPFTPQVRRDGSADGDGLDRLVQYACDVADAVVLEAEKRNERDEKSDEEAAKRDEEEASAEAMASAIERFPIGSVVRDKREVGRGEPGAYEVVGHEPTEFNPAQVMLLVKVDGRAEPSRVPVFQAVHTGTTTAPPKEA